MSMVCRLSVSLSAGRVKALGVAICRRASGLRLLILELRLFSCVSGLDNMGLRAFSRLFCIEQEWKDITLLGA